MTRRLTRPISSSLREFQHGAFAIKTWGPFLERPGNFSGPNSNIQIEIIIKNKSAGPG